MPSDSRTATTTKTAATSDLATALRTLGLRRIADELPDFVARATRSRWSAVQMLEEAARLEAMERARASGERRLARARLGRFKAMADFDWSWPRRIDREQVERVLALRFLERQENVVLAASQGLGKTMIARNIAHAAVLAHPCPS